MISKMKKDFTVGPSVERPITRDDLLDTEERMIRFFGEIARHEAQPGRFTRWNDSVDQLMEVAHWLARSRQLRSGLTGKPLTMKEIATRLCLNLHRRCPCNIYAVARQSQRTGRPDVVTYYTRLRVHGGFGLSSFVDFVEPISLPRLRSYRGVFDGGGQNG